MYFFKSLLILLTSIIISGCQPITEEENYSNDPTNNTSNTITHTHTNSINKSFNGEWIGQGVQSNGNQWNIEININSRTQKYTISYPSANCGGELKLLSVDDNKIEFNEKLTYGLNECTDHGKVILVKRSENRARYIWYFQQGTQDAWGEVERKKNSNLDINEIVGKWKGTYSCNQELTTLNLTIKKISTEVVEAIFNFSAHPSNPNIASGSYQMIGEYTTPNKLDLETYTWINRPPNHEMIGLQGGFNSSFTTYRGSIPYSGCTTFSLSKIIDKENKDEGKILYKNFGVTTLSYKDNSNWDTKIQQLFGSEYRVADWNDLINYYNNGGDLLELYNGLGLTTYGDSAYVKRSGGSSYSETRHYYASRHNHHKPSYYLAHENIDNHLISLGSWYGSNNIMAIKK